MAAASLDSEASFQERALKIGVSTSVLRELTDAGYTTFGKLCFAVSANPTQMDDGAVDTWIRSVLSEAPTPYQTSCLRRLLFEANSLNIADLHARVEPPSDNVVRRLPAAERAARSQAQQARLTGVVFTPDTTPANGLVDLFVGQLETEILQYVGPERCVSRAQEMMSVKVDKTINIDQEGRMRVASKPAELRCETSSDAKLRSAWNRRSLAMDLAGLCSYIQVEKWVQHLFSLQAREEKARRAKMGKERTVKAMASLRNLIFRRDAYLVQLKTSPYVTGTIAAHVVGKESQADASAGCTFAGRKVVEGPSPSTNAPIVVECRGDASTATVGGTQEAAGANELAKDFLSRGRVTRHQLTKVFAALPNSQGRRQGDQFSKSFVCGAYVFSGISGVCGTTRDFADCVRAFTSFIHESVPDHTYTSIALFSQVEAPVHQDSHNLAGSLNAIFALSSFTGGGIVVEDHEGPERASFRGKIVHGRVVPFVENVILFDAQSQKHWTQPWTGSRQVMVAYSVPMKGLSKEDGVFAGSASLSKAWHRAGFQVLSFDWKVRNVQATGIRIFWDLLFKVKPVAVHFGLPCDTASRARERGLPGISETSPEGLRLQQANKLYEFTLDASRSYNKLQVTVEAIDFLMTSRPEQAELHARMSPSVAKVMKDKKIVALKTLLSQEGYDDLEAVNFLSEGVKVLGSEFHPECFEKKVKPASLTEQDLRDTAQARREAIVGSKQRPIDDACQSQTNAAYSTTIRLELHNADYIASGLVTLRNKPGRAEKILEAFEEVDAPEAITRHQIQVLHGLLNFAAGFLAGRSLKHVCYDLLELLEWRGTLAFAKLKELARRTREILEGSPPRLLSCLFAPDPILIWTDGSWESGVAGIGACVWDPLSSAGRVFAGEAPSWALDAWRADFDTDQEPQLICHIELFVMVTIRWMLAERLLNRRVILFVDNESARFAILKGGSHSRGMSDLVRAFDRPDLKHPMLYWVDRVPSYSNVADGPSRKDCRCALSLMRTTVVEEFFWTEPLRALISADLARRK
ncbi:unnamed protein product, partial [Symbiodinium sp. CCMP2456]